MEEKLKIYLDTDIIYGFFKANAKAYMLGNISKIPFRLQFLQQNAGVLKVYTSFFSFIELVHVFNDEEKLKLGNETLKELIKNFRRRFEFVNILDVTKITGESLKWFINNLEFKDAIQVNIAKTNKLVFVTANTRDLAKMKQAYQNSISFKELANLIRIKFRPVF